MKCKCCKRTIHEDYEDADCAGQWLKNYVSDGVIDDETADILENDPRFEKMDNKGLICEDCFVDLCYEIVPDGDFSY